MNIKFLKRVSGITLSAVMVFTFVSFFGDWGSSEAGADVPVSQELAIASELARVDALWDPSGETFVESPNSETDQQSSNVHNSTFFYVSESGMLTYVALEAASNSFSVPEEIVSLAPIMGEDDEAEHLYVHIPEKKVFVSTDSKKLFSINIQTSSVEEIQSFVPEDEKVIEITSSKAKSENKDIMKDIMLVISQEESSELEENNLWVYFFDVSNNKLIKKTTLLDVPLLPVEDIDFLDSEIVSLEEYAPDHEAVLKFEAVVVTNQGEVIHLESGPDKSPTVIPMGENFISEVTANPLGEFFTLTSQGKIYKTNLFNPEDIPTKETPSSRLLGVNDVSTIEYGHYGTGLNVGPVLFFLNKTSQISIMPITTSVPTEETGEVGGGSPREPEPLEVPDVDNGPEAPKTPDEELTGTPPSVVDETSGTSYETVTGDNDVYYAGIDQDGFVRYIFVGGSADFFENWLGGRWERTWKNDPNHRFAHIGMHWDTYND